MTWTAIAVLAVGTYLLKSGGLAMGSRQLPRRMTMVLALLPAALLAALAAVQTVQGDDGLVVDARIAGVGGAAIALALRAPFVVAVAVAMIVAALLRVM